MEAITVEWLEEQIEIARDAQGERDYRINKGRRGLAPQTHNKREGGYMPGIMNGCLDMESVCFWPSATG